MFLYFHLPMSLYDPASLFLDLHIRTLTPLVVLYSIRFLFLPAREQPSD